jgi:hypothetical protein
MKDINALFKLLKTRSIESLHITNNCPYISQCVDLINHNRNIKFIKLHEFNVDKLRLMQIYVDDLYICTDNVDIGELVSIFKPNNICVPFGSYAPIILQSEIECIKIGSFDIIDCRGISLDLLLRLSQLQRWHSRGTADDYGLLLSSSKYLKKIIIGDKEWYHYNLTLSYLCRSFIQKINKLKHSKIFIS